MKMRMFSPQSMLVGLVAASLTAALTAGCSGTGADCAKLCETVVMHAMALGCMNLPPDCEKNCQTVNDALAPCSADWAVLVDCQINADAAAWECDPMGGMALKEGTCEAEDMAFDACVDAL